MGEYGHIAECLAGRLREAAMDGGITSSEVAVIVGDALCGEEINCYPGAPGAGCHRLAVFVSLMSKKSKKGRGDGHLTCRQAIEKVVRHMQGSCVSRTNHAVLVTDNWDVDAFDQWRSNLLRIRSEAHLEVYLLAGGKESEINL